MAIVFSDVGIIHFKWLPEGETINGQYYIKVFGELR